MPIVDIHLIAGRSQAQLKGLVEDVTAAVVKNTGAPAEHVHVILSEMQKDRYSVGGVLSSDQKSKRCQTKRLESRYETPRQEFLTLGFLLSVLKF